MSSEHVKQKKSTYKFTLASQQDFAIMKIIYYFEKTHLLSKSLLLFYFMV